YRVAIVARRAARLEAVAHAIRGAGGTCVTIAGDVTARDMPARIVAETVRAFGRIDVVVNNAGRGAYGRLLEHSDAQIDAQWQLNAAAPLRIARAALPYLEKTHGQLVFLGTGSVRIPVPAYGAYAPAKAALRAAATQLRRELRPLGIAVTYVDPGLVATEFHVAMGIERAKQVRAASPERVARAILRGIAGRRAVVNAVPWQTAGAILGEWAGTLIDPIVISTFTPKQARHPEGPTEVPEPKGDSRDTFQAALEPVARRMERVKLSQSFLRDALVPGATLELNELAMRWAGMPNKNERGALREALDALAAGGFLEPAGEERWRVLRAAQ
ncbi:MAG: SDR family NAD(P)-dependent oxidoreductase, partial [Candidatus Baltobacteraceae bacterium]